MEDTNSVYILDVMLYPSRSNGCRIGIHALLINRYGVKLGRAVSFSVRGNDYYGEVTNCIQTEKDSELYRFFTGIAGSYLMGVDLTLEQTGFSQS